MNLTPYLPCFCLYLDDKCLSLDKDSCLFTGLKLETNKQTKKSQNAFSQWLNKLLPLFVK